MPEVREFVAERQGWRCADPYDLCVLKGEQFPQRPSGPMVYEVDHCIPWCIEPDSSLSNLQALCCICHRMKTLEERSLPRSHWWRELES